MYRTIAPLVLASASPRRRELLSTLGIQFEVSVSNCDEGHLPDEDGKRMVERLSLLKAKAVAEKFREHWILGADTDVELDHEIYGKPESKEHAEELLSKLQGRVHTVWGGIAVVNLAFKVEQVISYRSEVKIRTMDEEMIRAYVATGEPLDKAGAYAIQGFGSSLVEEVRGSYTNVVGLNLCGVVDLLRHYSVIATAE